MTAKFRKSLIGFNQNDVIEYIKEVSASAKAKEEELNTLLAEEKKKNEVLTKTNAVLGEKLAFFEEKYQELNQLCDEVARVYLTTKASSKAIIDTTKENCNAMQEQVDMNINTLNEVQAALLKLKEQVTETANVYSDEVNNVSECLTSAKSIINANKAKCADAINEFNNVVK